MNLSKLKAGFILSYAAIFIQSIISIAYTPVMLRLLGQSDYGLLQLATSAVSHLGILSFGFSGSYLRFYSSYRAKGSENGLATLNGMFMMVFVCAATLATFAGGVLTAFAGNIFGHSLADGEIYRLRFLLVFMTINLAVSLPNNVFDSFIIAHERFVFQKILVILSSVLNPMLTYPLLLMNRGSIAVAACIAFISLLKLVISGIYCVTRLNMKFAFGFDKDLFKSLCTFSFFLFLNAISDQINWNSDKTILGIFKGSDDVALYSLGSQFNSYFMTFSYVLTSLFSPRAYRIAVADRSDKVLTKFFAAFGRVQISLMAFVFLAFFAVGKPFMRLWSGIDSDVPFITAIILTSPLVITSMQTIGIEIQRAKDMHRFRSVLYTLIALGNIAVSIPLCIKFGVLGCAAGTCAGLVIGNIIIMNVYYHRRVGLDIFYFWKQIARLLPSFIAPVICAVVMNIFLPQSIFYVITGGVMFTAVYIVSAYSLGMGKQILHKGKRFRR